jgi:hypothetical protein
MTAHVSNTQILDHIKTATSISVEGKVYDKITVTDTKVSIGPYNFLIDHFDIGGLSPQTIVLMDTDSVYRHLMLLGEDDLRIEHPDWSIEQYDPTKIRNHHLLHKDAAKTK